jgi:hypothetical protein
MQEASDLTESEPVFFVSRGGGREQGREDALHANWRANNFQLEMFKAMLWALNAHTGFVEVMADPTPPRSIRIRSRNPFTVFPDPFAPDWREWEFVIIRVPMSPDDIVRTFGRAADRLPGLLAEHQREVYQAARTGNLIGSGPESIELPPGAMQTVSIGRPPGATDYLTTDYLFIKDEAREDVVRNIAGSKAVGAILPAPKTIPKYPTGRLMIRSSKLKLWDGMNPYRRFPIIPIFGMPPQYGVWGTPPIQFLIQMQHLAESMYSQSAENSIRLNYGYRVIADGQILNPDALDKLGGTIRVKTGDDVAKAFRVIAPQPFAPHQQSFPSELLADMKRLFGYTPEREGKSGAGNISPGLMSSQVAQAESITRMRARLLADSVEHIGRLVFETMVDFLDDSIFSDSLNGDFRTAPWEGVPLQKLTGWKVQLDAASIKPMSKAALRQLVPVLANLGWLTPDPGLEWLGVPRAKDIAKKIEQQKQMEMMMAALGAAQKKGGRGKK